MLKGRVIVDADLADFCADYSRNLQQVPILKDAGSKLLFESIQGPAIVHLNDSYYPGWKAIDVNSNKELAVFRSNLANRAVYVPEKKEYQIKLTYQPSWLIWVQLISLAALISLVLYLFVLRKPNRENLIAHRPNH